MQSDLTSKDTVIFKPYFKIQLASTSTVDKISSRGKKIIFSFTTLLHICGNLSNYVANEARVRAMVAGGNSTL